MMACINLKVSADNTFNVKAYANGVSTAFPIRLIIALVSPSFHLMDQFKLCTESIFRNSRTLLLRRVKTIWLLPQNTLFLSKHCPVSS